MTDISDILIHVDYERKDKITKYMEQEVDATVPTLNIQCQTEVNVREVASGTDKELSSVQSKIPESVESKLLKHSKSSRALLSQKSVSSNRAKNPTTQAGRIKPILTKSSVKVLNTHEYRLTRTNSNRFKLQNQSNSQDSRSKANVQET